MIAEVTPTPGLRREVLALLARVAQHDGVAAVGEAGLLDLHQPRGHQHLVARRHGDLCGYAWTDGVTGEVAVAPQWRGRGHGAALVERVLANPGAAVWAHGTLPAAVRLADRLGLAATRSLWRMAWDPAAVVVPPLPGELTVRPYNDDAAAWLALNARVFARHPDQGRWTAADFAARLAEPWFDPSDLLLVEHRHDLVAFAWLKRTADEAEVYILGVAPEYQRRGVAAHLLGLLQQRAAGEGASSLTLFVEGDNLAARRSYVRSGFRHVSTDTQFAVVGSIRGEGPNR